MVGLQYFATFLHLLQITPGGSNCRQTTAMPDLDVSQVWILWELNMTGEGDGDGVVYGDGGGWLVMGIVMVVGLVTGVCDDDDDGDWNGWWWLWYWIFWWGHWWAYCCGGSVMIWVMTCVRTTVSLPFVVFQDREHGNLSRGLQSRGQTSHLVSQSWSFHNCHARTGNSRMLIIVPRILGSSLLSLMTSKKPSCPVRLWHPLGFGQFLSYVCFCCWELSFLA